MIRPDFTKPGRRAGLLGLMLCTFMLVLPQNGQAQAAVQAAAGAGPTILVVGDSLSAEYGLKRGSGWVRLLEQRLASEKIPARVVNASISGDTTSGGRSRLPAVYEVLIALMPAL